MITLSENKIILENSEGETGEFEKVVQTIPLSLGGFVAHEKYQLVESDEVAPLCDITSDLKFNLVELAIKYEPCSSEEWNEISGELKILSAQSTINRIKENGRSKCVIKIRQDGDNNSITMAQHGFFSAFTANIFLSKGVFDRLFDTSVKGVLQRINLDIKISGFDLGCKLGQGLSGFLIESGEKFNIENLSTAMSNHQSDIVNSIDLLRQTVKKELVRDDE